MSANGRRLLMIEQGGRGGVTDYTIELVRELAAQGWSITLATADDHRIPPIDGVTVERVFRYARGSTRTGRALRDRKSTRLNSSHSLPSRMPSSA